MKSIQLKKAKRHAAAGHIVWAPVASKIISSALATASDTTFSALDITSIISRRSYCLQKRCRTAATRGLEEGQCGKTQERTDAPEFLSA